MSADLVSIVVVAASPLLSHISTQLDAEPDLAIVATCEHCDACLAAVRTHRPDIALLDSSLPPEDILRVASAMKAQQNQAQVLLVSRDSSDPEQLIACHVSGAFPYTAARHPLIAFLRHGSGSGRLQDAAAPTGGGNGTKPSFDKISTVLTGRERQIMRLVCEGWSNKEVGRHLSLSEGTIKVHLHHIFQKLAVRNRTVLAGMAMHSPEQSSRQVAVSDEFSSTARSGKRR